MMIDGYELNLSQEELDEIFAHKLRQIELITPEFEGYKNLPENEKKVVAHLVKAAKIMNDVSLEQDHPLNRRLKKALEKEADKSSHAAKALRLFNCFNGVAGLNGLDPEPIQIFKGVKVLIGRNFYPSDLSVEEFQTIIKKMLQEGKIEAVKNILSARTMVRRKGAELEGIDYTQYFAKEFSAIANELEVAAHYTADEAFKDYLGWQAQALIQNNEDMDMLADKHWAVLQDSPIEFTISRENYDDEMSPTICENPELKDMLDNLGIEVNSKDMLGVRVGIVNKKGTDLLLTFKEQMKNLAGLMPYADKYKQNITAGNDLKQTMVDVDLIALKGDYAQCRGGITTAQNLPNDDKLSIKTGGGRRNVYHRQVRMSQDKERTKKLLNALVSSNLHGYYNPEAEHIFVIGHENGHSLGPDSSYKNSLGVYKHTIEENKADVVSIAMMPQYVKAGIIDEKTLKEVYTTWIVRIFLKAQPQLIQPHRMGDLIHFNYLLEHGAISFNSENKLEINFAKLPEVMNKILAETIEVQLSKSAQKAKEFIDKYTEWKDIHVYIAKTLQEIGIKPYIEIREYF